MNNKKEKFVRINSRITKEQQEYIKRYAKRTKMTEGEVHRFIIDAFINLKGK